MSTERGVSDIALSVGLSVLTFGVGIAPVILAPFSEINGRKPVFVVAGILFVVFHLCCALTRTYWGMIISRFLEGCASSAFSTVVAGVVSDIYVANDRNTAMAMFSGAVQCWQRVGSTREWFHCQTDHLALDLLRPENQLWATSGVYGYRVPRNQRLRAFVTKGESAEPVV